MTSSSFTISQEGIRVADAATTEQAVNQAKSLAAESGKDVSVVLHRDGEENREVIFHPDGTNDKIWRIDKGRYIRPVVGQVYTNRGGGKFRCIGESDDGALFYNTAGGYSKTVGVFQNVLSGWTFTAKGIIQFIDGTIEWSHSTGGHFEEPVQEAAE